MQQQLVPDRQAGCKKRKPAMHIIRQLVYSLPGSGMKAAMKPFRGQPECYSFNDPARLDTGFRPVAPEWLIACGHLEKMRHLVDMVKLQRAMKEMPYQMQRGIRQSVGFMQCRHLQSRHFTQYPPGPEWCEVAHAEALGTLVPELEVQFDRSRHLRIEVILPPAPAGLADHPREVVADTL